MALVGAICLIYLMLANSCHDRLGLAIGTEMRCVHKGPSTSAGQKWGCAEAEAFLNTTLDLPF